jgi:archaemetzincin
MFEMRDDKPKLPVSPLNVLLALLPIAFGAYIAIGLLKDFSKIGDAPRRRPPAPRIPELPGRPAKDPGLPPQRTESFAGGYDAIAEWLRPLHRSPANTSAAPVEPRRPVLRELGPRRTVYVLPIGELTPAQGRVVALEAELLAIAFGLEVRVLGQVPVDAAWPEDALRRDERWGDDQLLTSYILEEILVPRLPADAAALIGVTARDLWSGDEWSYSRGETNRAQRVGVWSFFRDGDPAGNEDERREVLRAAFADATREVGRMLSFDHASPYACALRGAEGDPPWLCPDCEAALLAATGVDPVWRYERLVDFYRENDLGEEEWFYERSLYAVRHIDGLAPIWRAGASRAHQLPECRRVRAPWEE